MIKINNEKKKNDIVNEKTNYKNGGGGGGGCHPTLSVPPLLYCNLSKKNFFFLGFALQPFTNHRTAGELEGIYLTPHYHFHPLHRHLHISRSITAESSPLHIRSNRT